MPPPLAGGRGSRFGLRGRRAEPEPLEELGQAARRTTSTNARDPIARIGQRKSSSGCLECTQAADRAAGVAHASLAPRGATAAPPSPRASRPSRAGSTWPAPEAAQGHVLARSDAPARASRVRRWGGAHQRRQQEHVMNVCLYVCGWQSPTVSRDLCAHMAPVSVRSRGRSRGRGGRQCGVGAL